MTKKINTYEQKKSRHNIFYYWCPIKKIYASKLYKKLQNESTKMWHLGPVALYEELTEELNTEL